MDVLAVHKVAREAIAHVRSGAGPYVIEAQTYRYRGHSMSDPAKYRTKEEVAQMRQEHDPIDLVRRRLIETLEVTEEALKQIDREIKEIVTEAAEFAQSSPEPDPAELWTDVLIEA